MEAEPGVGEVWVPAKELETANVSKAFKKSAYEGEQRTRMIDEGTRRVWRGFSLIWGMIASEKSLRYMI